VGIPAPPIGQSREARHQGALPSDFQAVAQPTVAARATHACRPIVRVREQRAVLLLFGRASAGTGARISFRKDELRELDPVAGSLLDFAGEAEQSPALPELSKTSGLNPAGVTSAASPAVAQAPRDRGLAAQLDETQRFRLTAPSVGCDSAWAVGLGA
jgi:hypothetical protein